MKRRSTAASTPSSSGMAIPLGGSDDSGSSSGGSDVIERQSLVSSQEIFHDDGGDERKIMDRPSLTGQITSLQASASIAKAIMGAGSFSLPWAFAQTGYVAGPILMLIMASLSVSLLKTLVRCRRLLQGTNATGPTVSYVDVARAAFGDTGAIVVYCTSISASVGVCGSYLVFIAASLVTLMPDAYAHASSTLGQTQLVLLILPAAVLLSSVRDSNRFAFTALLGDASVLLGMVVVMIYGFIYREHDEDFEDEEGSNKGIVALGSIDGFALAFGAVGFLFFIHFLVLPIEGSMQHPEYFDRVVSLTFLGCAVISALFGVAGYSFFGDATEQIVILNIKGSFFVSCVKILLCIDLLFTYPVVMRPSVLILEQSLSSSSSSSGSGSMQSRLAVCSGLGAIAAGAGIFIPAFALLSGLVGGVCQTFLAFVMPPLMLQSLKKGNIDDNKSGCKGLSKTPNEMNAFACVAFGVGMIIWTIGSTWSEMRLSKS